MTAVRVRTAYFDESRDDPNHAFAVVAGFVASMDAWDEFELRWASLMVDKPPRLHWKNFVQNRDHNVAFSKVIRDCGLHPIDSAFPQIGMRLLRAANVQTKGLDKARRMLDFPYSICAITCCEYLDIWAHLQKLRKEERPIKVVFDDGNAFELVLKRAYKAFYSAKSNTYLSTTPSFEDDDCVLPLQAAHLYAWLLSKSQNERKPESEALNNILEGHHSQAWRTISKR
jgi:hypothetical protein